MTLEQWLDRASGYTLTLPEGFHYPDRWGAVRMLDQQEYVTLYLDNGALRELIGRALRNKSQRSQGGTWRPCQPPPPSARPSPN